jgi:hypothetical protein
MHSRHEHHQHMAHTYGAKGRALLALFHDFALIHFKFTIFVFNVVQTAIILLQ